MNEGVRDDLWFDDAVHGGPTASTREACRARKESWEKSCGDGATVYDRFTPKCS